ncbi:uncharacterized protein B0I36DRAFT_321858 [Microdochium trichocladiopsis]|uniref:Rhodopsin domain-containing protein n=1 Tax=Microdochium trichocladiopsis TaxID=1682393 RepID=A0A9P8Y9W9_9PEZI|nr:uncharacterized protein B0I36DRAFT_321858 [Microdochium trichocladiopsis]KAH7033663.1 hypothetical protein B0I36DRAFT_321858 [Microdochium trichocladiopsis]
MAGGGLGWVSNPAETRGPLLQIVTYTLLGVSTIFVGLRLQQRWITTRWRADDYCLILAQCFHIAFAIITQFEVSAGFGKHSLDVPFTNLMSLAIYGLCGITVAFLGITVAKISFAFTLLNLANSLWSWINWVIWFIVISLIVFTLPVAILPWVQCDPLAKAVVDFIPGTCVNKWHTINFGIFQGIYSGLMDLLLAFMPWKIVWNLQMRPIEKVGVGMAMSLGCVAGAMAFMRASLVPNLATTDVSYDGALYTLWGEIEMGTTIIAACIPALRRMIRDGAISTRNRTAKFTGRSGQSSSATGSKLGVSGKSGYANGLSSNGTGTLVDNGGDGNSFPLARLRDNNNNGGGGGGNDGNEKNKRRVVSSNKWYSAYDQGAADDSDESIMLRQSTDAGMAALTAKYDRYGNPVVDQTNRLSSGETSETEYRRQSTPTLEVEHHGISVVSPVPRVASRNWPL